jgi:phosphoribosylanthranilate isomerase
VFVKICGITKEEDALLAVALGADAIGFVFAPGSPRQLRPAAAAEIVKRLPPGEVMTVGVFRDERPERVVEIVNTVGLRAAQLHGREPVSDVRYVRQRVPFVIQGFSIDDPALASVANGPADVVLVEGPEPGSGRRFDWSLTEALPRSMRVLLAGGLTPDNVSQAILRLRPWGVDVSSGVETSPGSGRKDARKLKRFIEAAREASAGVAPEDDELGEPREPIERNANPPEAPPARSRPAARVYDWADEGH